MNGIRHFFAAHWRLVFFLLFFVLFLWLLWWFLGAILPFVFGLVIAYLLLPIVQWLERRLPGKKRPGLRRALIIAGIYLVGFAVLGSWVFYIVTVIVGSFATLLEDAPQFVGNAYDNLQDLLQSLRRYLPPGVQSSLDQAVQNMGQVVITALQEAFSRGVSVIVSSATFLLGFISLPFFVFLVLKDWEKLREGFYDLVPEWGRQHTRNVAGIVDRVFGSYLRAEMVLGVVVGSLVFIMLTILGIDYSPALASLAGVMELIPVLGPWVSAIAGVSIALATQPDKAIWVAAGYLAVQQIENNLLVPRIAGTALRIHPAFILVVGVVGAYLAGLLGFIIAVPLAATLWEIFKYVRSSLRDEDAQKTTVVSAAAPGGASEAGTTKKP